MSGIGKFLTDDLLGIVQYPDVKHASAQYDDAYAKSQKQAADALTAATGAYGEAKGYRDQAGGIYSGLNTQGLSERDAALAMLNKVLGEYGPTAGLATPLSFQPAAPANPQAASDAQPWTYGGAPIAHGSPTPAPSPVADTPAQTADPYALTQPQQIQANQQVDQINSEKQSVIDDLTARYAAQGITDPRAIQAGIESINERYDSLASGTKAKFAEGARENREQSLAGMVDFFSALMQGGTATQAGAAGGLSNVGGAAQGLGDTQSQIGANINSNLTGMSGNKLQDTQQQANAMDAAFAQLVTMLATGGFSGLGGGGAKKTSYADFGKPFGIG